MIYLDGLNTGAYPAVRDAETHEVRYAKDKSEIPNWAHRVEVNGAHILVETYDGRRVSIRGNNIKPGDVGEDWYDADHRAFMNAIHDAEAALRRMLAAKGIQTTVEGEAEQRELSAVLEQMDDGQTIEIVNGSMITRHAGGWVDDKYTPDTFDVNETTGLSHDKAVIKALFG